MGKRLSPSAVVALKEALSLVYWYKSDLRSFLFQCVQKAGVLASIDWGGYKRQIVSDVVDRLCGDQECVDALTRLCVAVAEMKSFAHLEQLDGGKEKANRARSAVAQLRAIVETREESTAEERAMTARQAREAERLAGSAAVRERLAEIRSRFNSFVTSSDPQRRGYQLEKIMYDVFELFDLDPKASFRVIGEQIDGAFSLDGTDYLFEAKWQSAPCDAGDLDKFAAKVHRKLDNTLGLFLSIMGITAEGLTAHSRSRASVLAMDGAHLMAVLEERIDFTSLLVRVRRHAAQTGEIHLPIHRILGVAVPTCPDAESDHAVPNEGAREAQQARHAST